MRFRQLTLGLLATGACVLGATPARATVIPNANFDTLYKPGSTTVTATTLNGGYTIGIGANVPVAGGTANFSDSTTGQNVDVPGWTGPSTTGVQEFTASPGSGQFPGGADTAPYSVYVQGPTFGGAANTLVTSNAIGSLADNTNYTLTIRVGWRKDVNTPATPVVLNLNENGVALTPDASSSPDLVQGAFVTYSRTYNAASLASFVGQPLTISFGIGAGANPAGQQTEFDTVALTDTLAPEPASLGLIGLAGLGLLARRRGGRA